MSSLLDASTLRAVTAAGAHRSSSELAGSAAGLAAALPTRTAQRAPALTVGVGTVMMRDAPARAKAAGVPARVIGWRGQPREDRP